MSEAEVDARKQGYYTGLYGDPATENPYVAYTPTSVAWRKGWEKGHTASERMKTRKVRAW